jgi:hypothetical protein
MANRQLEQRSVTNVVAPDDKTGEMAQTAANLFSDLTAIKQKQDQANMNNFAAQAQLDIQKATQDWRVQNESQPMDDKAVGELQKSYDTILNQYDSKVGFLSRGDWGVIKNKIKNEYQAGNQTWGLKQSIKNAETSINTSIKTNLDMAYQYGVDGDWESAKKHHINAALGLDTFSDGVIGNETRKKLTEDFKADYTKSFVMGRASVDPASAMEMLGNEDIIKDIGNPKDVELLKAFSRKQQNAMVAQQKQVRIAAYNDEYLKIINNESSFEQIDSRVESGEYNADDAVKLKKMLVKTPAQKDDKLTIARYLDNLSSLPIDSQDEAQAVMENIMADDKIMDDTKAILLYGKKLGGTGKDAFGLSDMAKGENLVDSGKSWYAPWTWFKDVNRTDAVDAFIKFKKSIQGDESPTMLRKKASRAVSDVVIEKNPELSSLGDDWEDMIDGNGTEFMARMNEDGEIETKLFGSDNSQTQDNQDEDVNNGD